MGKTTLVYVFIEVKSADAPLAAGGTISRKQPMNLNRGVILVIVVPRSPLRVAGLVLMSPALALVTVARFQLGNSFSRTPQAKNLVTHGEFANPSTFSGHSFSSDFFLFLERPWLLLLIVPMLILQTIRAHAESRVLEERFGEEYRRYRASTWF